MAGSCWNGWKWLEWLEMARNGQRWLEMAGMYGNCWKWLELSKWLKMAPPTSFTICPEEKM